VIITVTFNPSCDKTVEIPGFAAGQTVRARTIRRQPAGKGVNVSRCMAAMGCPSTATGFLGRAEADIYDRSFEGTEVAVDFVHVKGDTRQNTTILDPGGGPETHIREEGFTVGEEEIAALEQKLGQLLRQGDLAVFSGSSPPGMVPAHTGRFVAACKAIGCYVAVDTSGPALAEAVEAGCSIAKPNICELEELAGRKIDGEDDIMRAAQQILERVKILLVTLGEGGAYCFTSDGAWKGTANVKDVRNTVGAGDAFLAGFAVGYTEGRPLDACLRQAVACGTASTLKEWAGEIDPGDVKRLAKKVKITQPGPYQQPE